MPAVSIEDPIRHITRLPRNVPLQSLAGNIPKRLIRIYLPVKKRYRRILF